MRVLVVDDYPDAAEAVSQLLTVLGHETCKVSSGAAALSVAEEFDPDLVILDLSLPDANGYDLASTLAARSGGRAPRYIVALSGSPADRTRTRAAHIDDHITKPPDLSKLRDVIAAAEARSGS